MRLAQTRNVSVHEGARNAQARSGVVGVLTATRPAGVVHANRKRRNNRADATGRYHRITSNRAGL